MYDISASIVLYKTRKEMLERLASSFMRCDDGLRKHIFFVDNDPGTTEIPKWLRPQMDYDYIPMEKNVGYGAAHNRALTLAARSSDYVSVINPDVFIPENSMLNIYRFMQSNSNVVECMPRVESPSGELQYLCKLLPTPIDLFLRRFFHNLKITEHRNSIYELHFTGYDHVMDVPCLSGCFMFFRSSAILKHGLSFDERFFMYLEDFDIIRRCHRIGRTVYFPNASIIHDHQRQSYKDIRSLLIHTESAVKYFNKYGWFFDKERRKMNQQTIENIKQ